MFSYPSDMKATLANRRSCRRGMGPSARRAVLGIKPPDEAFNANPGAPIVHTLRSPNSIRGLPYTWSPLLTVMLLLLSVST